MSSSGAATGKIDNARTRALGAGVLFFILALILGFIDSRKAGGSGWAYFLQCYDFAFIFWFLIAIGSMALLMMHHLTGGWWGLPIRRILEAGSRTIWVVALLFLPILLGAGHLYNWTHPGFIPDDVANHFKHVYLQRGFFTVRAIIYFGCWFIWVYFLNKWSVQQDETGDPALSGKLSKLSAPGLVMIAITLSGAVIDWVMSLEPEWFSTMYGFIFMVACLLVGMAFSIVVLRRIYEFEPLRATIQPKRLIDMGNLMLAFLLLLTYTSFAQFLIIWSGNLKNEIPWYMVRAFGGWGVIGALLLIFHFFIPFFLLLQRRIKKQLPTLAMVAFWFLILTLLDVYWIVVPAYEQTRPQFRVLDFVALIGIGGLWLAAFFGQLRKLPLLPLHDPRFEQALERLHGD
jgi:hypothetical protein